QRPEYAARLAQQWRQVGNASKEAYYAELAGDQALQVGMFEEGVAFYSRVLDLLPDNARSQKISLLIKLGESHREARNPTEAIRRLDAAVALARAEENPVYMAQSLYDLALISAESGDAKRGQMLEQEGAPFLERIPPSPTRVQVLWTAGTYYLFYGEMALSQ